MSKKFIDLTDQKFGRLTVIKRVPAPDHIKEKNRTYWLCECECGNKKIILGKSLTKNNPTNSCGCLRIESITTHNMTHDRFYNMWLGIKHRCNYEYSSEFKYYGERGIKVCDQWDSSFENFRSDMYDSYLNHVKNYGEKNTTIDRINTNGNYEIDNCRWATYEEQNNNKRNTNNKLFKAISPNNDEILFSNSINYFSKENSLDASAIYRCLIGEYSHTKGWKFEYIK